MNSARTTAAVGLVMLGISFFIAGCATTTRDWEEASRQGSINAYETFLNTHPGAPQTAEAATRLEALRASRDWSTAEASNTISGYNTFLRDHPEGQHSATARQRRTALQEAADWQTALRQNTIEEYQLFARAHAGSQYTAEASRRVNTLTKEIEERDWTSARDANTIKALRGFLSKYPQSEHATAAEEAVNQDNRKRRLAGSISGVVVKALKVIDEYKEGTTTFVSTESPFLTLTFNNVKMRPATRADLITLPSNGNDIFVVVTAAIDPQQPVTMSSSESAVLLLSDGSRLVPCWIQCVQGSSTHSVNPSLLRGEEHNIDLDGGKRAEVNIRFETRKDLLSGAKVNVAGKQYDVQR